jgi:hypothetical protein
MVEERLRRAAQIALCMAEQDLAGMPFARQVIALLAREEENSNAFQCEWFPAEVREQFACDAATAHRAIRLYPGAVRTLAVAFEAISDAERQNDAREELSHETARVPCSDPECFECRDVIV